MPKKFISQKTDKLPVRMLMHKVPIKTEFEHHSVRMIKVAPKKGMTKTGAIVEIADSVTVTLPTEPEDE
jgi:hypothetical protein